MFPCRLTPSYLDARTVRRLAPQGRQQPGEEITQEPHQQHRHREYNG